MTLLELATAFDVKVRILYPDVNGKWYADLERSEICGDCVLIGIDGRGATPEEALRNLVSDLRGKRIVCSAMTAARREFTVPASLTLN